MSLRLIQRFFKFSDILLTPVEKLLTRTYLTKELSHPPVFILGAPRSGTTLVYQLLSQRYRFAYFTNFSIRLYHAPIIATLLSLPAFSSRLDAVNYQSDYGKTEKLWEPHEGGPFWYRWFPKGEPVYVPPNTIPRSRLVELRGEVIGMSRTVKAPSLFKNTYNSMRIAPLIEAFPEACFLVVRRDPIDIAQSILSARVKIQGDKERWWALQPKEVDEIKLHPYWVQIVEQVYYIYQQIESDAAQFGKDHFFDVHYEAVCENSHKSLKAIETFLESRGTKLTIRSEVPAYFQPSQDQKVSDEDLERIQQAVEALWK